MGNVLKQDRSRSFLLGPVRASVCWRRMNCDRRGSGGAGGETRGRNLHDIPASAL